ncbi:hypothetical protein DL96DRAFT_1704792 [Flagelloscypha sp. PMI_526]|nr:hypothetical protein DL96DRAFT_1704792 [Flagelloscypha sp. PMI_526]
MDTIRDVFKLKPYNSSSFILRELWPTGPRYSGDPRKDPPVNEWLKDVKMGCKERGVPKDYWADVGICFLGKKAKTRLDEVKKVMDKMHNGKWYWNWKRFKTGMRNMGWTLDYDKRESIEVEATPSLLWWFQSKPAEEPDEPPTPIERPPIRTSESSFWLTRKLNSQRSKDSDQKSQKESEKTERPSLRRESSNSSLRTISSFISTVSSAMSKTPEKENQQPDPAPAKQNPDGVLGTGIAKAPTWLLDVCKALDTLQTDHPRAMSVLSAILITAGTLPTLPIVVASGTGILATHAVQAAGAVALGVGNWLQSRQIEGEGASPPDQKIEKECKHSKCNSCGK